MPTLQQNPDGTWSPVKPLGPQGPVARLEFWLRARGFRRIARFLGRVDEIGL
jgi:hypothetical protein